MVAALHDRMPVIVPARGVSFEHDDAVLLATPLFGLLAARLWVTRIVMKQIGRMLPWLTLFAPIFAFAQIDPVKRDLIQLGYNQAFEGHAPYAGYAFYYHNQPDFLRTNLTLRLALAPVYLDSEFGFVHGLGPNTDFAIGLAGGGFADSYNEIDGGKYYPDQSFNGHGGEISASVYHLFNPGDLIPLNLILRGTAHYSTFDQRRRHGAHVPSAGGSRRVQRAHRFALGRHRADAVSGARDGIVRLV